MTEVQRLAWRPAVSGLAVLFLAGLPVRAQEHPVEAKLRQDVTFLAGDECEGRGVTTQGIHRAADYIAAEFERAGLKPGGEKGFFQPFTMSAGVAKLDQPAHLRLRDPQGKEVELKADQDFRPLGLSGAGKVTAPVVFAGYGIVAESVGYDDYKGLDVAGKVVVLIRRTPRQQTNAKGELEKPFDGDRHMHHASLNTKLVQADLHKAAAVLFVSDRLQAKDGDTLMDFATTAAGGSPTKLPAVHMRRAVLDQALQASRKTSLTQVEEEIDRDLKPRSGPLAGWTATLEVQVSRPTVVAKNVIGIAEGSGPLAREAVVIGAHYDHLGYGGRGSLAKTKDKAIHHGADDNASGTAVLMDLARRFGRQEGRVGRRLVFVAFSGEESGLLGSDHYCKHPVTPLADTVAMINMDMVGRLRPDVETKKDKLVIYGTGTAPVFEELLAAAPQKEGFKIQKVASPLLGSERSTSDHASFYARKVPVLFLFTGNHPDYHRPSDTADKINVAGMRRIADLVAETLTGLAARPQRPQFVKVASPASTPMVHAGSMPRLGIRPSYGDEKEGVLLDGVSEKGPAEKAGLREGDRLVELGGQPVKNLESYMVLIARQKKGQPLELGVLREGKRIVLKVTPE